MYGYKKTLFCPVCDTKLGYLTKDEMNSFLCEDCKFIYTWDKYGNLRPPIKYEPRVRDVCDCASCKWRNQYKNK